MTGASFVVRNLEIKKKNIIVRHYIIFCFSIVRNSLDSECSEKSIIVLLIYIIYIYDLIFLETTFPV